MTYSIVAFDRDTGELGVGVQTHRPTVGAVVPWVEPGIGAVATQSRANVAFGRQALELMKTGLSAQSAMGAILAGDSDPAVRQVGIVDSSGLTAVHTGDNCIPEFGSVQGDGFSAQANMMLCSGVPEAMAEAFVASSRVLKNHSFFVWVHDLMRLAVTDGLIGRKNRRLRCVLTALPGAVTPPDRWSGGISLKPGSVSPS